MFGFKSLTAVAAIVAAVAGGLVAYVYEGDPAPVVTVSAPESTGEDAGFVVPDEFRQRFAEGFQISPEVEAALQQRIEQGLIPEGGGFFPAPDGGFGRIAPDKPAGAN